MSRATLTEGLERTKSANEAERNSSSEIGITVPFATKYTDVTNFVNLN